MTKPGKHLIAIIDMDRKERIDHRLRGIPRIGDMIQIDATSAFRVLQVLWPANPVSEYSASVECVKETRHFGSK